MQNRITHRNGRLVGTKLEKRTNMWVSRITINGRQKHLGTFKTEQEAHEAYMEALKRLK